MNGAATAPRTHRRFARSAVTLRWSTDWRARSTQTRCRYDSTRSYIPSIGNAASVKIEASRHGQPCSVQAKRAIITLPLGVLQLPAHAAGAVRFVPDARKQQALAGLAPGPVIKVVLHFRKPFWEEIDDGRYRDGAFFRVPGAPFPTFWSTVPLRGSLLNAWAGGPKAKSLAGRNEAELACTALDSLQSMFGRKVQGSQPARTRIPARLAGRSVRARRLQLRHRGRHRSSQGARSAGAEHFVLRRRGCRHARRIRHGRRRLAKRDERGAPGAGRVASATAARPRSSLRRSSHSRR